jgi:lipid-A-disaccharide synthase
MSDQLDYFIFAGEPSGDLLGYHLMQELICHNPTAKIEGVFGPKMRLLAYPCVMHAEDFQVMGFIDVIKNLRRLIKNFVFLKKHLLKNPPKHIILIDYPGFNLRLAKSLKKAKCPSKICQYVCPSVWAWKYNRVKFLKKWVDLVACLFPFEPMYLEKAEVPCTYVGHPLAKALQSPKLPYASRSPILLIFPGSRKGEIERNLRLQVQTALTSAEQYRIGISCANDLHRPCIENILKDLPQSRLFIFPPAENSMLMEQASLALATSGTITLELALHHLPTIVCYQISRIDYYLAKYFFDIRLPFFCIVNFLMMEEVFPEFYGKNLSVNKLSAKLLELLNSSESSQAIYEKTLNCAPSLLAPNNFFNKLENR